MIEYTDSIVKGEDISAPIFRIAENTEPINLVNWDLAWWSFSIAMLSLIAGIIAAIYSYRGYKFQRISAERLEKLTPGQISYFEVVCCLINNILDLESVFFSQKSFRKFPINLILSISKLPEDLINLEKYEKNKACFENSFHIKIAWRNYNLFIDDFAKAINIYNDDEIRAYAQYLITLSKSYIRLIQKFELVLVQNSYLNSKETTSNNRIAYFILDRFFECINDLSINTYDSLDIKRINYNIETKDLYTVSPYLPNIIDIEDYFSSNHSMRLSIFEEENTKSTKQDVLREMYNKMKSGEYDFLGKYFSFPKNVRLSSIDINYFKRSYFMYMEPVIIGLKRLEYEALINQR